MIQLKKSFISSLAIALLSLTPLASYPSEQNTTENFETKNVIEKENSKDEIETADNFPDAIGESFNLYEGEFAEEMLRRYSSLDYIKEFQILHSSINNNPNSSMNNLNYSTREQRKVRSFLLSTLRSSASEWSNKDPYIRRIRKTFDRISNYEITIRGGKSLEDKGEFFEIEEEKRIEELERERKTRAETTVEEFGKRYEASVGTRIIVSKNSPLSLGLESYVRMKNIKIFGERLDRVELGMNTGQELSFRITKLLGEKWYSRTGASLDNEGHDIRLSFTREERSSLSTKFNISPGYNSENGLYLKTSFGWRF